MKIPSLLIGKRKVRHIFSLIPLLFVILVIYVCQHEFLNITFNHRVIMQYSGSTRSSCGLWEKKKTKQNLLGQLLSLSDILPFSLSIYLLQVQFVFFLPSLGICFFFFFSERPCFLFPLEMAFRKPSLGLTCSLLLDCGWHDSPCVCTASCTHLRVTVSGRPSLCTHTPKHKFTLTDRAPGHP